MNTAVINIKTNPQVKAKAQKVADELGFSLSGLINAYLKNLIQTKTVYFSLTSEEPSEYFLEMLKESEKDIKAGRVISFDNGDDAIKYLNTIIDDEQKSKN